MALPTSGALTLDAIHVEAGGSTGTTCSLNDTDIRGLTPGSGKTINSTQGTTIDFDDFYGASSVSVPASFGKTGITPGVFTVFTSTYYLYWNEKYRGPFSSMTGDVNVRFNETSEFLDSSNNTETIVSIVYASSKSPTPAFLQVTLLGHNAPTSTWTLSWAGLSITGNSGFTYSGASYGSPTASNFTATGSSGTTYNITTFSYNKSGSNINVNVLPTTSNQSWTIT